MENDFQQQQGMQNNMGTGQQPSPFDTGSPKKKNKKWLIIITGIVLVLGVATFNVIRGLNKINNPGDTAATGSGAGNSGTAALLTVMLTLRWYTSRSRKPDS